MKQPTINQINGRLENSPTINFYKLLNKKYDNYQFAWQHREFNFSLWNDDRQHRCTVAGTFIYGAAMREFSRICNIERPYNDYDSNNKRYNFEYFGIHYYIVLRRDIYGVTIDNPNHANDFPFVPYSIPVRSNQTFEQLDGKDYFIKNVLPNYVFTQGLLAKFQYHYQCNKAAAIEKLKQAKYSQAISLHTEEYQELSTKSLVKALRHKNIVLPQAAMFTDKELKRAIVKYNKPFSRKVKLLPEPNIFELYDELSSQYDTDEGLMEAANDILTTEKNAIYI